MENNDMEITAEVGGNYVMCPAGNHVGSCCAMVVVGTVLESFKGSTPAPAKKVFLAFEITGKTHIFKEEKGPEPFVIWVEHLLSLHTKANLRKMIQSWAGETYSDDQMKTFKLNELVGAPCLVNVIADKNSEGKDRVKIATISAVPDATPVPAMINKPLIFNYTNPFNSEAFDRIPEWIQKKMKTSDEYKQALGAGLTTPVATQSAGTTTPEVKKGFPFAKKN